MLSVAGSVIISLLSALLAYKGRRKTIWQISWLWKWLQPLLYRLILAILCVCVCVWLRASFLCMENYDY